MIEIGINGLIRFLSYIAPFITRRMYTQERLASKVKITVGSEGDGVYIQAGQLPRAQVWLEITNLTPFPIEPDRVIVKLSCGQEIAKLTLLERRVIQSTEEQRYLLEQNLTSFQVDALREQSEITKAQLEIYGFFLSKVHNFSIINKYISTNNVRVVNLGLNKP